MKSIRFEEFTKNETDGFMRLYERSFNSTMSYKLFEWKYALNSWSGAAAFEGGEMVSFYGGISRELLIDNNKKLCVQITDTMVDPSKRAVFKKGGIFKESADMFLNGYIGEDKRYSFCFGFPSARHALLGEKLGIYATVDTLWQYLWDSSKSLPKPKMLYSIREIDESGIEGCVKKASSMMQKSFPEGIRGDKSFEYMKHRYLQHPLYEYKIVIYEHKLLKSMRCLLVYKEHREDMSIEIMDILGEKREFSGAMAQFLNYAKQKGFKSVYIWSTARLGEYFPTAHAKTEVCKVCITKHGLNETQIRDMRERWIMSGGESDFR